MMVHSFLPSCHNQTPRIYSTYPKSSLHDSILTKTRLEMSSVGDDDTPPGGGGEDPPSSSPLDDFLDPRKAGLESENLKRARARLSEESLPITFGLDDLSGSAAIGENNNYGIMEDNNNTQSNDEDKQGDDNLENDDIIGAKLDAMDSEEDNIKNEPPSNESTTQSNLMSKLSSRDEITGKLGSLASISDDEKASMLLKNNPYLSVVSRLSPSDLISKFTSTAHPRVQEAVRSTVLGLIGNLPKMAFDTTTVTTGERLASLMFQLQMTGYMFKNAEYRLTLTQSLGMRLSKPAGGYLLSGENDSDLDDEDDEPRISTGKIRGKIKVSYGKPNPKATGNVADNKDALNTTAEIYDDTKDDEEQEEEEDDTPLLEVEVDAEAYMSELRSEVSKLRDELTSTRAEKEEAIQKDLLLYIRTLPERELRSLTSTMSEDVLVSMKGLVNVVMSGIGEGKVGPDTVTEQSGEAMAQLCMWQLVVGYNLREMEVREEMKGTLLKGSLPAESDTNTDQEIDEDEGSSVDFDAGGFE